MAGHFPENELLKNELRVWLDRHLPDVSVSTPIHIHTDELVGADIAGETIDFAQWAFESLIALLGENDAFKLILLIPLVPSINLRVDFPADRRALRQELDLETPSLYVLSRDTGKYFVNWEEYVIPVSLELFRPGRATIHALYKAFRAGIEADEYSRCFHLEHVPEHYFLP